MQRSLCQISRSLPAIRPTPAPPFTAMAATLRPRLVYSAITGRSEPLGMLEVLQCRARGARFLVLEISPCTIVYSYTIRPPVLRFPVGTVKAAPCSILARAHLTTASSGRTQHAVEMVRSEEHTSELQSLRHLVCRLLLEKKKKNT